MIAAEAQSPAANPRYPGAQPFGDDPLSRKLFFGRDHEIATLTHQVLANRLTVLFARSGLGKTSLLNAGVAESLRAEGFVPLTARVDDRSEGALASVYRGIVSSAERHQIEYVDGDRRSLWAFFKSAQFWHDDVLLTPILILDQFEELFTLQSPDHRDQFLQQFSNLVRGVRPDADRAAAADGAAAPVSDTPPQVKIVVSMREDFLANLEEIADRVPEILDQRFRLMPLGQSAAIDALNKPAELVDDQLSTPPFTIDGTCADAIVSFLKRSPAPSTIRPPDSVEPFQLQLVCQYLEDFVRQRDEKGVQDATLVTLEGLGGEAVLKKILKTFYRRQVASVNGFLQRRAVQRLCAEFLINPQGRRLRMEESEIRRLTSVKLATLQTLVDRRVLRREQTADGNYYELSHDSLVLPILTSRRLWFLARTGRLLIAVVVVGLVLTYLTFLLGLGVSANPMSWNEFEVLVAIVVLPVVYTLARSMVRSVRELITTWRRMRV